MWQPNKAKKKKYATMKHWSSRVHEITVARTPDGRMPFSIIGGAQVARFPYVGDTVPDIPNVGGSVPKSGHIILEANGTPLGGLTNRDVLAIIANCSEPLRLKFIKAGRAVPYDLRVYLNRRFATGSIDHVLQQNIRDNLYLRTIPCTTRPPREGEVPGVDYNFISEEEFLFLEQSGALMETGTYNGTYYNSHYLLEIDDPKHGTYYLFLIVSSTAPSLGTGFAAALRGAAVTALLRKTSRGFGFTVVGGDSPGEPVQVRGLVPGGPATEDGHMVPGDVITHVDGECVLGRTQSDVVDLLRTAPIGATVRIDLCRGYPLPIDSMTHDPSSRVAKSMVQKTGEVKNKRALVCRHPGFWEVNQNGLTGRMHASMDKGHKTNIWPLRLNDCSFTLLSPLLGSGDFGFTLTDSPSGERIRHIARGPQSPMAGSSWESLCEGDVLVEAAGRSVHGWAHSDIIRTFREWPQGEPLHLVVARPRVSTRTKQTDSFEPGFGFRLVGGEPIRVGALVPGGAAERDGRLHPGDELLAIDGVPTVGIPHARAVSLMQRAARTGRARLRLRYITESPTFRKEQNCQGLGHIVPEGAAAREGHLQVGDRVVAIDGESLLGLTHADIVSRVAAAEHLITLTVSPSRIACRFEWVLDVLSCFVTLTECLLFFLSVVDSTKYYYPVVVSNSQSDSRFDFQQEGTFYMVELERGPQGFGFSVRGGREAGIPLLVLRLADGGPAALSGRMQIGDELVEIGGESCRGMSHSRALQLIRGSGQHVSLLLKRGTGRLPGVPRSLCSSNNTVLIKFPKSRLTAHLN
uniref:Uncharacterized protein n=1 Tax=Eptatretus burgeri TaxID=7764 RepID=A0A8C4Q764_EPTBU